MECRTTNSSTNTERPRLLAYRARPTHNSDNERVNCRDSLVGVKQECEETELHSKYLA